MPTVIGYRVWFADGAIVARSIAGLPVLSVQAGWESLAATGWLVLCCYLDQTYQTNRNGQVVTENDRVLFYGRRGGEVKLSAPSIAGMEPWASNEATWYWFDPDALRFGAGLESDIPLTVLGLLLKEGSTVPDGEWWGVYAQAKESRATPVVI